MKYRLFNYLSYISQYKNKYFNIEIWGLFFVEIPFFYHLMKFNIPIAYLLHTELPRILYLNGCRRFNFLKLFQNFGFKSWFYKIYMSAIQWHCQRWKKHFSFIAHVKRRTPVALSMLKGAFPNTNSESTSKEHVQQFLHLGKNSKLQCRYSNNIWGKKKWFYLSTIKSKIIGFCF